MVLMSVMTVVYVPEGIAMAADSRMTRTKDLGNGLYQTFPLSDNNQKIFLVDKVNVGISTCGSAFVNNKTIADFIRLFEIEKVNKEDNIIQVANSLSLYLQQFQDSGDIRFYVAGYLHDEAYVYSVDSKSVNRMNISEDGIIEYGACWGGANEAICKLVNGEPVMNINFYFLPLKDAADYAEFLVSLTINYQRYLDQPAVCGGPVDVLIITKDGASFIRHKLYKPKVE
jgi:hypothetical protein